MACRNGAAHLAEALEAVLAQGWDGAWEFVFADNGSTDASRAIFAAAAARHPAVPARAVDAGARPGKSFALNLGVDAARGRAIVLADADDIVAPSWLSAMAEALERHDFVAACNEVGQLNRGPAGLYRDVPASTWTLPFAPFARCTAGATMGFTRALHDAVGGFDPAFQPEDDEFCIRAHLAGFELISVPAAVVHCRLRGRPDAIYAQAFQYSRTEVQIAKAYRGTGPGQRGAWRGLAREALALAGAAAGLALSPGRADPAAAARLAWRAGVVAGQVAGVVRHRAAPTLGRPPRGRTPAWPRPAASTGLR
jgi:glycosyltransferase involved in cell wall biosynthesis